MKGKLKPRDIYSDRRLSEGYPQLARLEHAQVLLRTHHSLSEAQQTVSYIERLLPDREAADGALVVGCGARPAILVALRQRRFNAVGVEPIPGLAVEAREFLADAAAVLGGTAERLPVADESQSVVLLESVLEHVDSPDIALAETYRVLHPGGLAYIATTNRLALRNHEYRLRFFQWYPSLLKEAYIHHHLHFDPSLGNYTTRPAVHWFTHAELCRYGRAAGFSRFYSKLDVINRSDPPVASSWLRRVTFERIRTTPILRALALTQRAGGAIFMMKRPVA